MARGLDQLEGEGVELVLFVILVLIAVIIFATWKGFGGLGNLDPSAIALSIIKKIWNAIDSVFSKSVDALSEKVPTGSFRRPHRKNRLRLSGQQRQRP